MPKIEKKLSSKSKLLCPNEKLFSKSFREKLVKDFYCNFTNLTQSEFDKIANDYPIILMRHSLSLKYKKASNIKYIISPTTGENHIDKKFIKKKVNLITLKNENFFLNKINSTAEQTIYLILCLLRNDYQSDSKNIFEKKNINISEIHKKNIGIIGYGRLGKKVAKILKSFGAKIQFYDISNKKKSCNLFFLLNKSDIISLHIPLNYKNKNFLNGNKLRYLKKNCILINTSRGEIVDQKALIRFIKLKKIKYATDVLCDENDYKSNSTNLKLLQLMKNSKSVYITPHIGGLSKESIEMTDSFIVDKFLKSYE